MHIVTTFLIAIIAESIILPAVLQLLVMLVFGRPLLSYLSRIASPWLRVPLIGWLALYQTVEFFLYMRWRSGDWPCSNVRGRFCNLLTFVMFGGLVGEPYEGIEGSMEA